MVVSYYLLKNIQHAYATTIHYTCTTVVDAAPVEQRGQIYAMCTKVQEVCSVHDNQKLRDNQSSFNT